MSQLPVWALWIDLIVRAAGTIGIGAFVAYIAHKQWNTAHERIMLDLFERRMSVYDDIRSIVARVVQEGECSNAVYLDYVRAGDRLPMMFGKCVVEYFEKTRKLLNDLHATMVVKSTPASIEKEYQLKAELAKFSEDFSALIVPYVRMTQRLPHK